MTLVSSGRIATGVGLNRGYRRGEREGTVASERIISRGGLARKSGKETWRRERGGGKEEGPSGTATDDRSVDPIGV